MIRLIERWLLFRPTPYLRGWSEPHADLRACDVWLTLAGGLTVHAWWCEPEGWRPDDGAVLHSHGNAGNLSHRGESVRRWLALIRRAVLIYDYPGYGRSGGKPDEAACYASAEAALTWIVREKGVRADQIVLHGGSLGCAVSIEMATRHPYHALVLVSPFTSVPDMAARQYPWLPARRFIRNRFDNLAKIGRTRGRLFLAHGTADRFVPYGMGEQLFGAAPGPKEFMPMVDHDHYHSPGPEFYSRVPAFLEQCSS